MTILDQKSVVATDPYLLVVRGYESMERRTPNVRAVRQLNELYKPSYSYYYLQAMQKC
jgi:hypothetical protein